MNEKMITLTADEFLRIRAILRSVADGFKEVMEDGLPKEPPRRASMDAVSAHMEWHECRWYSIREAEDWLKETEGMV